jgi:hypothetical protein
MKRHIPILSLFGLPMVTLILNATTPTAWAQKKGVPFSISRIFIEYNGTANDAGFHVRLDAEDWKELEIVNPKGRTIFEVGGNGGFGRLGMTELFFEGAEPSLDEVPVDELLALFPEGQYNFFGRTVDGKILFGASMLTHAVPAGPSNVSARIGPGKALTISWDPVKASAAGFPNRPIEIVGYQVILGDFQVTVPDSITSLTVSPEFVSSLEPGRHMFEVLAIEAGGNQTITETSFTLR